LDLISFGFDCQLGEMTEVQPGSYLFMDTDYGINEEKFNVFKPALFVLGTVISKGDNRFVIDAGIKSHAVESGLPSFFESVPSDWQIRNGGDEHMAVDCELFETMPQIGDLIKLIPGHVDPTFNLHNQVYIMKGDKVEGIADIFRGPV